MKKSRSKVKKTRAVSKLAKRRGRKIKPEDADAKFMTLAAYARHSNTFYQTAMNWRSKGWLVVTQDDLIDVAKSDVRLLEMRTKTPEREREEEPQGGSPYTERGAKQVKESYIALRRKLEFEIEAKQVARIATLEAAVAIEYSAVRTKLSALGTMLGPTVILVRTAAEATALINDAVNAMLEDLTLDDGSLSSQIAGDEPISADADDGEED